MKRLLLILFAFIFSVECSFASLSAGDIAIIGINTDNSDAFGFVALVDIPANTTIYFTDNGVKSDGSIRTGEGTLTWSSSSTISKGTVITWEGGTWSAGSSTGTGPAFSASGDQCIAYTGSASSPTFIYALNIANSGWVSSGTIDANSSYLPSGLTDGTTAIHVSSSDNGYYSGTTSGTKSDLLSSISNSSNWTVSNTRIDKSNWPSSFTVNSSSGSGNDQTSVVEAPASQIAAGTISSLKTTQADAVDVFTLKIVDKGSGDGLPTHVTNIRVKPGANNTADWTNTIQGVTLNDGSAVTIGSPTITDGSIDIPITSGNLDIADGGSKEVTLAVYLNTSNIEDGSVLEFMVEASSPGFTADASGSGFASSFSANVVSNDFTLAVVGTQLAFSNVPSSVIINTDFSTTVSATDANGNVDKDDATSVTLSKNTGSGTLSSASGLTQSLSSGTYTWNDLRYNTAGTFKMAANGGSYSEIVTGDITASTPPKLIISEVSDPNDHTEGRFVEIYNMGSTNVDFSSQTWYLSRQANGSGWADVALTGTLNAGETYVIAYNSVNFKGQYGFDADLYNGAITGSGNDGYFLYYGGDHSTGTLIDAYGVIDEDGTGKPWEYLDKHAVRLPDVTGPNATWTSSEWAITGANVADMTPSVYKVAFTWAGGSSADWGNKANWSIAGSAAPSIPDVSCTVTIPSGTTNSCSVTGTPDYESDVYAITIASGASLTVPAGKALSTGDITNNGTLTVQSDATGNGSLIVHGTATGNITVQRYIKKFTTNDITVSGNGWHEIGCPVTSFSVSGTDWDPTHTGTKNDLYYWDESQNLWMNYRSSAFDFSPQKGYLVANDDNLTHVFTGTPNTSDVTVSGLTYTSGKGEGWHLLGNPYPSAIKWNDGHWTLTNVGGTAEIWDEASGSYKPVSANGIIPSTNGFFVQVAANQTGSVTIPADARVHDATNNYKEIAATPKETLTFKITDDANSYSDKSILGFKPNATEDWDMAFDAHKLMSLVKTAPQIWTVSKYQNFLVNYIPETSSAYDIPLHFKPGVSTVYHLSVKGVDSFNGASFVLEDLKTGDKIDLGTTKEYDFSAEKGDDVNRFVLHINGVTAVPGVNTTDGLHIFSYGKTIYLNAQKALNGKVTVFNLMGQKVYESPLNGANKQQFRINQKNGIYFIRVERNNQVVTRKIFIQ